MALFHLYNYAMGILLGSLLFCCLLDGLILGFDNSVSAQVPGSGVTPSGPIGASMAVLATLQDADVLPQEETPEANRIIKLVIQFQSAFMKSHDPALQRFLSQAFTTQEEGSASDSLSRFRVWGWTSEVLEALNKQWMATASDQQALLGPGFRQFNASRDDFDRLMGLVAKAQTAFMQRGQTFHQVFAQRRREMPGGAP